MLLSELASGAQNLLTQFADQLPNFGVVVPPAQYVAGGIVAWDGESLTVYLGSINQGQPGAPFGGTYVVAAPTELWATFYVQILREVPALNPDSFVGDMIPDADVLGDSGQMLVSDAQGLVQAAVAIHAAYTATGPGEGFSIGPVSPLGPDGGLGGFRLELHLSLG